MSAHALHLVVVGLSHRTASLHQRERAALSDPATRGVLRSLRAHPAIHEAAVLSTCNRTEVYAVARPAGEVEAAVGSALVAHTRLDASELACVRYSLRDDRAVEHLFRVAAGLDSMVTGESEIQGQVRAAGRVAEEEDALGAILRGLFRHALEAARRVRRQTGVAAGPVSVSSLAVQLARHTFPDLPRRRALVVGAGRMAEAAAAALVRNGVRHVVIANRTLEPARTLADRLGARAVRFDVLADELAAADFVVACTDAPHYVVTTELVQHAAPLLVVDVAVPRDVDPAAAAVPGIVLRDIDDLEAAAEANLADRRREAERAAPLIRHEVRHFAGWRAGLAASPVVDALHARAEAVRRAEIERRKGDLTERELALLDAVTRSLVTRLLHEPTVRLRDAAAEGPRHLESVRHLFALDDDGGDTVVRLRADGSPRPTAAGAA
ncbi:MAG: glutamyl-tRNA reductase [Thermoleophilaceae bacterium]